MFLVCEAIAWGMEHVPFNAAFLRTIRLAYPDDTICFYAEESHSGHVREQIGEEFAASIIWKKLILPPRHSSFYARLHSDFKTVKFLLNELNENPSKHVLVITGNPSLLWALKFNVCTVHKNKRIQVVLHEGFYSLRLRLSLRRTIDPFYRIGNLRTALKLFGNKRIQHIVLEEAVRNAVLKELPFLQNNLFVFDHPIPPDKKRVEAANFIPPVQFGFLGLITGQKGFSDYLKVASDISTRFPGLAKFNVIGRFSKEGSKYSTDPRIAFLTTKPLTERLSRDEYIQRLNNLHFICLFYDRYYESCASGVLLDSIAWGKPIVATRLPIFENLENLYGDIGYLCRKDELSDTISTIIQHNDSDRYKRQVSNMLQIKNSRTPETLAVKYRELVECFNIN
jgi:glycosyltransferase involved in cell wall biosynthesis